MQPGKRPLQLGQVADAEASGHSKALAVAEAHEMQLCKLARCIVEQSVGGRQAAQTQAYVNLQQVNNSV